MQNRNLNHSLRLFVLACGLLGLAVSLVNTPVGLVVGTAGAPLFWMMLTLFFWLENDDERASRQLGVKLQKVYCPKCAYDMRGQRDLRCPECGTEFSIGELLELQPGASAREAEG